MHQASPTFLCPQLNPSLAPSTSATIVRFAFYPLFSASPSTIPSTPNTSTFFSVRRADSVTSRIFSFPIQDPVPADPTDAIYFFSSARFRPAILTATRNRPRNTTTTGLTHPRRPRLIDRGAPSRNLTLRRLWDPQAHLSDPRQSHPPARDILRCRARPRTGRHRPSCQHWHGPSRPFLDPRRLPQV